MKSARKWLAQVCTPVPVDPATTRAWVTERHWAVFPRLYLDVKKMRCIADSLGRKADIRNDIATNDVAILVKRLRDIFPKAQLPTKQDWEDMCGVPRDIGKEGIARAKPLEIAAHLLGWDLGYDARIMRDNLNEKISAWKHYLRKRVEDLAVESSRAILGSLDASFLRGK